MLGSDSAFASSAQTHSASWPLQHHIEVHAEDTREGVVLDAQVDVLLDAEPEAPGVREVPLPQFSVLDLEAALQDFVSLLAAHSDVHGDLLVTLDAETTDGVLGPGRHGLLAGEILQHFAG